jgi:hypothetical protein
MSAFNPQLKAGAYVQWRNSRIPDVRLQTRVFFPRLIVTIQAIDRSRVHNHVVSFEIESKESVSRAIRIDIDDLTAFYDSIRDVLSQSRSLKLY